MRLFALTLLAACTSPSDPADDVVDTPATDTVDTPEDTVDPVDTPAVDTPESECRAAPAELICGTGERPSPFVLLTDGQEVTMDQGTDGGTALYNAVLVLNTEQAVRLWQRVTDLRTGVVLYEGRQLVRLIPLVDGAWACDGYLVGVLAILQLDGANNRDLQVALCGHQALIEMASEDIYSATDAPTVYAASSVQVILRPDPVWEITCD